MQPAEIALILSIASFVGVIVGPILTNLVALRQSSAERRDDRRKARLDHFLQTLESLIQARAKTLGAQKTHVPAEEKKQLEEAFGILLSVDDREIQAICQRVQSGEIEKIDALDAGVTRLGQIINALY